jgi:hypothetical protein
MQAYPGRQPVSRWNRTMSATTGGKNGSVASDHLVGHWKHWL